jgi:hypothetical protein
MSRLAKLHPPISQGSILSFSTSLQWGTFHIDIINRLGDVFGFDDIEVEYREIEGITIPVATPRMLYRMKKDRVRLQDKADAERLRERFGLED